MVVTAIAGKQSSAAAFHIATIASKLDASRTVVLIDTKSESGSLSDTLLNHDNVGSLTALSSLKNEPLSENWAQPRTLAGFLHLAVQNMQSDFLSSNSPDALFNMFCTGMQRANTELPGNLFILPSTSETAVMERLLEQRLTNYKDQFRSLSAALRKLIEKVGDSARSSGSEPCIIVNVACSNSVLTQLALSACDDLVVTCKGPNLRLQYSALLRFLLASSSQAEGRLANCDQDIARRAREANLGKPALRAVVLFQSTRNRGLTNTDVQALTRDAYAEVGFFSKEEITVANLADQDDIVSRSYVAATPLYDPKMLARAKLSWLAAQKTLISILHPPSFGSSLEFLLVPPGHLLRDAVRRTKLTRNWRNADLILAAVCVALFMLAAFALQPGASVGTQLHSP